MFWVCELNVGDRVDVEAFDEICYARGKPRCSRRRLENIAVRYIMANMDDIDRIVAAALAEDIGTGDITTRLVAPEGVGGNAVIRAKSTLVLAGMDAAERTFQSVDRETIFKLEHSDGEKLETGSVIAHVEGDMSSLLAAERTALNFIQRASGIATLTARYVDKIKGTKAKILDTRKTAPGLRTLDKAAVRAGGGYNHRTGLFDGILIKENHIVAAGGIKQAVEAAKTGAPHLMKVEIEVTNLDELDLAVEAGAGVIMLDNMDVDLILKAVERIGGEIPLEVSGNVSLDSVGEIAKTGVDYISVGALTHSVVAADISMYIEKT